MPDMPNVFKKTGIIDVAVRVIYEDGNVRVVANSSRLRDMFPLSGATAALALKAVDTELKTFTAGKSLA